MAKEKSRTIKFSCEGLKVSATFSTENAAFHLADGTYEPSWEIAQIKDRIKFSILRHGNEEGKVMDTNGNSVGTWKLV